MLPIITEKRMCSTTKNDAVCQYIKGHCGGRSEITNFEDVVALDLKYIREWSIWLDIKLILRTIRVVMTGKGAV